MVIGVSELKGVTMELATALHALGINDADQLLAATGRPVARAELAKTLGVEAGTMLELANRADLMRICGLSEVCTDLLAFAGVDTVMELSRRNPENLYVKLLATATHHHIQLPLRLDEVQRWVREARQLQRAVYY